MNELQDPAPPEPAKYEPPQIVWEEVFETTVFGISCAKHPGQPRCSAGPIFF
jgi:hypothetical protein